MPVTGSARRVLLFGVLAAGAATATADLPEPSKAAAAARWIGPAVSGAWTTPGRPGEGFVLQLQADGSAVLAWFTYPPRGNAALQAWIVAQSGVVTADRIVFDAAYSTRGPRFGSAFDSNRLQLLPWGRIELRFGDCNTGEVRYAGPAGWGEGLRPLTRLTAIAESTCGSKRLLTAQGARAMAGLRQHSASWFDPTHNGEGWLIEELGEGRSVIYWFSYDERGEQAWWLGVGASSGERISIDAAVRPLGTHFGADFDAADVRNEPWGRIAWTFSGCDRASLSYTTSSAAFGSGSLQPLRLNRLAGTVCHDAAADIPRAGQWSRGNAMPQPRSEIATATLGASIYTAGGYGAQQAFTRYDTATDQWVSLPDLPGGRNHALAATSRDEILVTGGFSAAGGDQLNSGWRFLVSQNRWQAQPELPNYAASGAATLNGQLWFGNDVGQITQFDPRTANSRRFEPPLDSAPRDHSQVVAFQGELWLLGGRGAPEGETARVAIFDPASESWRPGPRMHVPRAGFAAAASERHLIVAGGELIFAGLRVLGDVEVIAAGQDDWSALAPLPAPLHGLGGSIIGNAFYTVGGSSLAGGIRNRGEVQVYRWNE